MLTVSFMVAEIIEESFFQKNEMTESPPRWRNLTGVFLRQNLTYSPYADCPYRSGETTDIPMSSSCCDTGKTTMRFRKNEQTKKRRSMEITIQRRSDLFGYINCTLTPAGSLTKKNCTCGIGEIIGEGEKPSCSNLMCSASKESV